VLTVSALVACAVLPLLATVSSARWLAVVLFVFGAAPGSADCVMNVQAVIVARASAKPPMSGFQAFYSLGGIGGATSISILLMLGATPLNSTLAAGGITPATLIPIQAGALPGYALAGVGCSNIVPVLFTAVGRQKTMPQAVAVPAITTWDMQAFSPVPQASASSPSTAACRSHSCGWQC